MTPIELRHGGTTVIVDPLRGADILSIRHDGHELLFRTPWHDQAQAVASGAPRPTLGAVGEWLAGYRGGWQTLVPTAGDPAEYDIPAAYHGEASAVPWQVVSVDAASVRLRVALFTAPLIVERRVSVDDEGVSVADRISNAADVPVAFDYGHHPAFGSALLDGGLEVDAPGAAFTPDAAGEGPRRWPDAVAKDGSPISLATIAPRERRGVYGWLDVPGAAVTMRGEATGLEVVLEWDRATMPWLWVWQELGWDEGFPWFGRARVAAFEPMSRPTRIADRGGSLRLPGRGSLDTWVRLRIAGSR